MKYLVLNLVFLFAMTAQLHGQSSSQALFLDGHLTDSATITHLTKANIQETEFSFPYGYPSGALFVRTHPFVYSLRPAFYKNLKNWINQPAQYHFILDGKPYEDVKKLFTLAETDIEGFTITDRGNKTEIEIFLRLDFGLNYR